MEKKIEITVTVNNDDHAELIKKDIEQVVMERTTLFFIGNPKPAKDGESIRDLFLKKHPEVAELVLSTAEPNNPINSLPSTPSQNINEEGTIWVKNLI